MVEYRHVRMDLMGSREVFEYRKKNDLVILPIGCFEMHGPNIPLTCDTYAAWSKAIILADIWKCLVMPPIQFSFAGATGSWAGSVNISPQATLNYITEVIRSVHANGFKRVVACVHHFPLRWMMDVVTGGILREDKELVLTLAPMIPTEETMTKAVGYGPAEDTTLLAALKILGWDGAYDPSCTVDKPQEIPHTVGKLRQMGARGPFVFTEDHQHTGLRSCVKPEHAGVLVKAMKEDAAALFSDLPGLFETYRQELAQADADKPWERDSVWTDTNK